eukprot:GHVU01102141.1.p1 GENE.GHVU01102141.1~~GHVU01102141.1.p1  ORF type:complete len:400 (-),score=55.52 GHVU01102141.1:627-1826(-)
MPPRRSPIHAFFTDRGQHPTHSHYRIVSCKKCDEALAQMTKVTGRRGAPTTMASKLSVMENHKRRCIYHNGCDPRNAAGGSGGDAGGSCEAAVDLTEEKEVASTPDAVPSRKRYMQMSLEPTLTMGFNDRHKKEFHRIAIEMIAALNLKEGFFDELSVRRAFTFLAPGCESILPSRRTIGGPLLANTAEEERKAALDAVKDELSDTGGCLPVAVDSWENIANTHMMGVLVGPGRKAFPYEYALGNGGNVHTGTEFHGIAMAKELEVVMKSVSQFSGVTVGAMVSDDAGQLGKGRRLLALHYPYVYFGKCYAHDVNNTFKAVFFRTSMKEIINFACALISAFTNSVVWLNRLIAKEKAIYRRTAALHVASKDRWTTGQRCLASLLRVRTSIQAVSTAGRG